MYLALNEIPFDAKSIGRVKLQSKFVLILNIVKLDQI